MSQRKYFQMNVDVDDDTNNEDVSILGYISDDEKVSDKVNEDENDFLNYYKMFSSKSEKTTNEEEEKSAQSPQQTPPLVAFDDASNNTEFENNEPFNAEDNPNFYEMFSSEPEKKTNEEEEESAQSPQQTPPLVAFDNEEPFNAEDNHNFYEMFSSEPEKTTNEEEEESAQSTQQTPPLVAFDDASNNIEFPNEESISLTDLCQKILKPFEEIREQRIQKQFEENLKKEQEERKILMRQHKEKVKREIKERETNRSSTTYVVPRLTNFANLIPQDFPLLTEQTQRSSGCLTLFGFLTSKTERRRRIKQKIQLEQMNTIQFNLNHGVAQNARSQKRLNQDIATENARPKKRRK